jgi:hypothetical protein
MRLFTDAPVTHFVSSLSRALRIGHVANAESGRCGQSRCAGGLHVPIGPPDAASHAGRRDRVRRARSSARISAGARRVSRCGLQWFHLRGHQVRRRALHGGPRPALRRRVIRHTRRHGQAVVPPEGHRGWVAHRDPGHELDRDRLLVVGEQVGGYSAGAAKRHIDRGPYRRASCPAATAPPGTGTGPARGRTAPSPRRPPAARLRSRTAPTSPAPGSTAGAPAAGPPARPAFRPATARRVVRSDPAYPIAASLLQPGRAYRAGNELRHLGATTGYFFTAISLRFGSGRPPRTSPETTDPTPCFPRSAPCL